MIGIPIALATFSAAEWLIHKHLLHGRGKNKKSLWAFHWHEHHGNSRRGEMRDETYERSPFGNHAQGKELVGEIRRFGNEGIKSRCLQPPFPKGLGQIFTVHQGSSGGIYQYGISFE